MSRLPIPHIINTIKTKLGFDRTMTASGEDVVDAVNKIGANNGVSDLNRLGMRFMYYYADTLNSPYKEGLTDGQEGMVMTSVIQNSISGIYSSQVCMVSGGDIFTRTIRNGQFGSWIKITTQEQIVNLGGVSAIYITGNVAPTGGVTANKYYIWNGYLRHPTANIAAGETLTDSNMPIVTDGGLNDISTVIDYLSQCTSNVGTIITEYSSARCINNVKFVSFNIKVNTSVSGDGIILSLPSAMRSDSSVKYFKDSIDNSSYYILGAHIHTVGSISSGTNCRFFITYI